MSWWLWLLLGLGLGGAAVYLWIAWLFSGMWRFK